MGFTTLIRSVLALAVAALLGGTLLAASPTASASAPSATSEPTVERATDTQRLATCAWRRKRCFGAISLNTRTGVVGYANDKRSRSRAVSVAHNSCKRRSEADGGFPGQCKRTGWVRNGCLALAIRVQDNAIVEWGTAYAYNVDPAKRQARRKVAGAGTVEIHFWLCTTRRR